MADSKYTLGISCFYHDSAAALLRDGEIVAAAQEERFTRVKFDKSFPENAIAFCLKSQSLNWSDIDTIAFYEDPLIKLDRILSTHVLFAPSQVWQNAKKVTEWIKNKCFIDQWITQRYPKFQGEIFFSNHHLSHAASAFYPSPFENATILAIDAMGEWSCSSVGVGHGKKIKLLQEQRYPHSVGLLYSAITYYLGFKVNSGEYKVMGLAPYGEPKYVQQFKEHLVHVYDDGSIKLNQTYFDFISGQQMTRSQLDEVFQQPHRLSESKLTQFHMDVAKSVQVVTEEIVQKMVEHAVGLTGERNLVLSGGVALNCVSNGKVDRSGLVDKMWVQPASGDAGGALGAAFMAYYQQKDSRRDASRDVQFHSQWGPSFTLDQIVETLDAHEFNYQIYNDSDLIAVISDRIAEGMVVGLFHGRMEYGPRALGARSIIGDPRSPEMQKRMNLKIKFRESFRPFAPVVLAEYADQWFESPGDWPYMLLTTQVLPEKQIPMQDQTLTGIDKLNVKRSDVPAITHVDYSARIQTIDQKRNPFVHKVLTHWYEKTGCPMLINTSFNIRGEPIVCSPLDALRCFMNTDMDCLVLENVVLLKGDQAGQLQQKNYQSDYELD